MNKTLRTFILILAAALPLWFFQNCSQDLSRKSYGNGNGYGGAKPDDGSNNNSNNALPVQYVYVTEEVCADGSNVRAAIVLQSNLTWLVRENCQNIQPVAIASEALDADRLLYNGNIFKR